MNTHIDTEQLYNLVPKKVIRVQNSNSQPILVPTKPLFESSSNSLPPPLPAENQVTFQSPFSHRPQCTLFTHQNFA